MNDLISAKKLLDLIDLWTPEAHKISGESAFDCVRAVILAGHASPEPVVDVPRPVVTQRIIAILDQQNAKGVAKYGTTIDDAPDEAYDWPMMAMKEMVDALQYMQKEIIRLQMAAEKKGVHGNDA